MTHRQAVRACLGLCRNVRAVRLVVVGREPCVLEVRVADRTSHRQRAGHTLDSSSGYRLVKLAPLLARGPLGRRALRWDGMGWRRVSEWGLGWVVLQVGWGWAEVG